MLFDVFKFVFISFCTFLWLVCDLFNNRLNILSYVVLAHVFVSTCKSLVEDKVLPPLEYLVGPEYVFYEHLDEDDKVNDNVSKVNCAPPV